VRAHAHDLRAEVERDWQIDDAAQADQLVHKIASDWRKAGLTPADELLCAYAEKLTRHPHLITDSDIEQLRDFGFDDRSIHDATQVISYFNYINRIADALDVAKEDFVHPWEQAAPPR
jgi:uncharacterized peroxidase-related enzyme